MLSAYTVAQLRAAERVALGRVGEPALMTRAAWAVAGAVLDRLPGPRPGRSVVLLVGSGNNGGDALYAGARLRRLGLAVSAVLTDPERAHAGGLSALRAAGGRVVPLVDGDVAQLEDADVIVDGLVGIGARPPLRDAAAARVERANEAVGLRVAVDLPSGVDPDTGRTDGPAFDADVTVSLGAATPGVLLADQTGELVVAGIGMAPGRDVDRQVTGDPDLVAFGDADAALRIPAPGVTSDKYSGGVLGVVAGSPKYPGAAVLCVGAAVNLRPGLVRFAGPRPDAVLARWPEVVAAPSVDEAGRVQAWVVGPGMGTDGESLGRLRDALEADGPVLVDAAGLTLLAAQPGLLAARVRRGFATVLTPHAGEFSRMFADLDPADRLGSARAAATRSGATVLLKGHRTVVAEPSGRTAVNLSGSPALATAGSGDVLSGVIGSLLAAGLDPGTAAAGGAHLPGRAGELAQAAGRPGAQHLWDYLARCSGGRCPPTRRCRGTDRESGGGCPARPSRHGSIVG
jgi:hydroxyethylthiazole kinase-like uncharacterized protein yjeF